MQTFSSHVDGYHDVSDQLVDYLRRRAEEHFRRQEKEKAKFATVETFEGHRTKVRDSFFDAIGGLPNERTPLNAHCTGAIDRGAFVIEKTIYESLPGFYVTSALYLPKNISEPTPVVVFVHGHSDQGKSYPVYQAVCVDLANNGFIAFAIDPPGQGERFQYFDPQEDKRIIGGCTTEHTHAGLQFTLGGASVGRHFIWDVMRGLDYLETRPEVDTKRVGLTGNSGGGTQSCLLMMSEPRFAAAVPCTFVMSLEAYMKTGQPQDSEQIVRGAFAFGPDHDDYLTAMAPKPVLVGAAAYDYFPIEGAKQSVARAKQVYQLYGAEDKVDIFVAPTRHAYSPYLREACVNWYKKHFRGEEPDFKTANPATLPENELWCTPKGQILDAFRNCRTVFDLNRERLQQTMPPFKPITDEAKRAEHKQKMRQAVVNILGLPQGREATIHPRLTAENVVDGYPTEKIFFFSEPNIVVTGVMVHPKDNAPAVQTDLVLLENGTNDIPNERERLEKLLAQNHRLFIFDVRGVGGVEVRPVNRGGQPHGTEYKLGSDAMMLGISTLGLRVFDVLRGYDYLKTGDDVERVGLYGFGSGAIFAYFAATLEEGFSDLVFVDMLYSYRHLTETRYYSRDIYNLRVMAWGILRHFDLVDLLPCLAQRACKFITPRDAKGEVLTAEEFTQRVVKVADELGYLPGGWMPEIQHQ